MDKKLSPFWKAFEIGAKIFAVLFYGALALAGIYWLAHIHHKGGDVHCGDYSVFSGETCE